MMPVPSGAGFSSTLPEPNLPTMACGIVVPASGTRINPFFAASIPFLMAEGTSFALPTPKPTTPSAAPPLTRGAAIFWGPDHPWRRGYDEHALRRAGYRYTRGHFYRVKDGDICNES